MKFIRNKNVILGMFLTVCVIAALFFAFLSKGDKVEDIIVLYTNDAHCGIDQNIGYSGLAAYKKAMLQKTQFVTLVDCGDAIQGEVIGTISRGEYIIDIMNEVGYNFAILGNHEFDYGVDQLKKIINESKAQYLGCNINYTGSNENPLSDVKPYQIKEYGKTKIAFIGVSTPDSILKSTPAFFMENGEIVYDLCSQSAEKLYNCVQKYVDECKNAGANYVIVLSHLGDYEENSQFNSIDLIKNTMGIDVLLDGHSHSTVSCRIVKNINNKDVLMSSTGTKINAIGQLVITSNGNISTGLISQYDEKDPYMDTYINNIKALYEKETQKVVATSDIALSCQDANGIRIIRNREAIIGDFCADAYRIVSGADIGFINGGGIRADINSGDITYADIISVHPFGNTLCVVKSTGQEIMDALEFSYRYVLQEASENGNAIGENAGFMQVSGLKFRIDTSIESTVTLDENNMFASVTGERRVKDIYVLNKDNEYVPLEADKEYTVASHNYLIKNNGDGFNMFSDNELLIDESLIDNEILITYITENLNGKISEKYSQVDERIVIE